MTNSGAPRELFLKQVREAVREGNRSQNSPELDAWHHRQTGIELGALASRFVDELTRAGGAASLVSDDAGAAARVLQIVHDRSPRKVLLSGSPIIDRMKLATALRANGLDLEECDKEPCTKARVFEADVGITGADYLIAETGSIVLNASAQQPRSVSLVPPVHIAVAEASQILPDLFDLFQMPGWPQGTASPACVQFITGPSKTGDIELRLVTGVHGPGEVHVVLITQAVL